MPKDVPTATLRRSGRLNPSVPRPSPQRQLSCASSRATRHSSTSSSSASKYPSTSSLLPQQAITDSATAPVPFTTACSRVQRRFWRKMLLLTMAADLPKFAYLVESRSPEAAAAIVAHVTALVAGHPELAPPVSQRDYLAWAITAVSDPSTANEISVPLELVEAAKRRKAGGKARRNRRRHFNIILFTPTHYGHLTMTTFNFYVDALPDGQEYPPRGEWVAENEHLFTLWAHYLATMKLPDKRRRRSPTHLIDHSMLKYDMPADLNFQIFDRATGERVFTMVRSFCPDPELLDHGREHVHRAATTQRSIRLEDRGAIVQIGFSAGSRNAPEFGWVRNTLSKKTDANTARRQVSSFMTAFWLMAKHAFPSEVIDDFEEFHRKHNLPRFNPDWPSCPDAVRGSLKLALANGGLEWDNVDLAPGSGVMVQRYARAVHLEHQPHTWAINWTTVREGTDIQGGNFILAKYGILIRLSANSAFAWKPEHWHATTLANFAPQNDKPQREHPTFNQHSVAFVTSPRIGSVYQEWEAENGGASGAAADFFEQAGDEIYK